MRNITFEKVPGYKGDMRMKVNGSVVRDGMGTPIHYYFDNNGNIIQR
jgi:hypothetical protein